MLLNWVLVKETVLGRVLAVVPFPMQRIFFVLLVPLLVNWTIVGRRAKAHKVFLVAASRRDRASLGLLLRELQVAGGHLVSNGGEIAMIAARRVVSLVVIMLLHLTSSISLLNFGVLSMLVIITIALLSRRRVMSVSLVSISIRAGWTSTMIFISALVTTLFPSVVTSVALKFSFTFEEPALRLYARFSLAFSVTTVPSRIFGGKNRSPILEELNLTKDCDGSTLLLLKRAVNGYHNLFSVGVTLRATDSDLGTSSLHKLLDQTSTSSNNFGDQVVRDQQSQGHSLIFLLGGFVIT